MAGMTLQELLAGIQGQGQPQSYGHLARALGPLMGGGMGQAGPQPVMGNSVDSQIQQQIEALSQPEPTVEAPVGPESKGWQRAISALADAGMVYASGLNPSIRPQHFLGQLMGQDQMNRDRAAGNKARKGGAEREAQRRGDELKLRQLIGKKAGEAAAKERAEDIALREKEKADEMAFKQAQLANLAADRAADNARQEAALKQAATLAQRSDDLQIRLHKMKLTEEGDKDQHSEYAKSRQFVVAKAREWSQALAEGKATPEQVRQEWGDIVDASDLTGPYREAANAFFEHKMGDSLFPYEYENQGPELPDAPTAMQYTLGALGQRVTGAVKKGAKAVSGVIGPGAKK